MTQRMLRIVEARPGKPFSARPRASPKHPFVGLRGANVEVLPERTPESLLIVDGPLPQRRVSIEPSSAFRKPPEECRGGRLRNPPGPRPPPQATPFTSPPSPPPPLH